jgi:hypothetical protein
MKHSSNSSKSLANINFLLGQYGWRKRPIPKMGACISGEMHLEFEKYQKSRGMTHFS